MNAPSYPEMRLADIVEFLDDMRRDLPAASRRPGPYPCFGGNGYQGTTDAYLFDEPLVLLAEDLSAYTQSGKPHALAIRGKAWVSRRIHVLRPGPRIVAEYLACALEDLDLTRYASGARRNRLTRARALDIRVPVPPLDAQREIAAALVQADALRERRLVTKPSDDWADLMVRSWAEPDFATPGGETSREAQVRGLRALDLLRARHADGGRLLVGSHGMLISLILQSLEPDVGHDFHQAMPNPAVFHLEHDGIGWRVMGGHGFARVEERS